LLVLSNQNFSIEVINDRCPNSCSLPCLFVDACTRPLSKNAAILKYNLWRRDSAKIS
jgi:hypothetical protein